MYGSLDDEDRKFLHLAVQLSASYQHDQIGWPFGALLVMDGEIVGQGVNQVVELHDPSAHAEVMALRAAGASTGWHLFKNSVLYSSCEPCPMCLAACCWALVPRIVYAATAYDAADNGIRDLDIYAELVLPAGHRSIKEDASDDGLHEEAVAILRDWNQQYHRS
jgi:guanine deaminase